MISKRSKSERVHLPMLNLALQQNELAGKPAWPDKYIIPKHLMLKGSKRRELISQTNIKPYRKNLKTEEPTLMEPLSELEQLSKFFEKYPRVTCRNFGKRQQRKPRFPEQEQIVNKHQEAIRLANSRIAASHQQSATSRNLNPEREHQLLEEFNRELHVRRWGELGLAIKSENEKQLARHNIQKRSMHIRTDP